jgi:uncharacterized protein (DUF1499 family)
VKTSRSLLLALAALVAAVLGPLGAFFGVLPPMAGFVTYLAGGPLGLVALIWGAVAKRTGATRGGALAVAIGAVPLLAVLTPGVMGVIAGHPPINDITTNPADPPMFIESTEHGEYPEGNASQARKAYPDIEPLELDVPASRALAHALEVARERGWEIAATRNDGFEAYTLSRLFRFRDDVVVRVRGAGSGSVIDARSASRDGKGDLGVNAARIESFLDAVKRRAR